MSVVYEHLTKGIYRDIFSQNMFCSPPTDCKLELEINKEFRDNFQKNIFFYILPVLLLLDFFKSQKTLKGSIHWIPLS